MRRWINAVLKEEVFTVTAEHAVSMESFTEVLKDGRVLCRFINVLQPGSVPKINDSKMAFKMVNNSDPMQA